MSQHLGAHTAAEQQQQQQRSSQIKSQPQSTTQPIKEEFQEEEEEEEEEAQEQTGDASQESSQPYFRVISYNVNGLRRCSVKRGAHHAQGDFITSFLKALMNELDQDMESSAHQTLLCFQETKLQRKTFFTDNSDEFETFCLVAGQGHDVPAAGYSGVTTYLHRATAVENCSLRVEERRDGCLWAVEAVRDSLGLGEAFKSSIGPLSEAELEDFILPVARTVLDFEGRCLTVRLSNGLCVINFYGVAFGGNANAEDRLVKKMYSQVALECVLRACLIQSSTQLMVVGDFNSVHRLSEDRARAVAEAEDAGSTNKEKSITWIGWLCQNFDLQDTWLEKNSHLKDVYTCWNQMTGARVTNYGSRIDLILASKSLNLIDATAHTHVLGSDHCPISATFALPTMSPLSVKESVGVDHAKHRQMRLLDFMPGSTPTKKLRTASRIINSASPVALVRASQGSNTPITPKSEEGEDKSSASSWLDNVRYLSKEQQKAYMETAEIAPKCYKHQLPCILRTVVNKKRNLGRKFWVCCLPDGSGGGTARCNYFAWHK